jgi:hypothetical protein
MRLVRWSLAAGLIGCFAVLLMYRAKDPERRTLDDAARLEAPGRFVRLADGVTHYETAGPDTGRVVVLAAGFSVPAYIWDSLHQGPRRLGIPRRPLRLLRARLVRPPRGGL